ncbi:MAG: hypothetical protein ABIE07_12990 [Candidatus Zixiibacteriota bacterium]
MNEKVRKSIVFGIFIVAIIWGYSNLSQRWSKKPQELEIAKQQVAADILSDNTDQEQIVPGGRINHDSVFTIYEARPIMKNPFYHNLKNEAAKEQKINLRLLGIMYRPTNAQALINDKVLGIGGLINGYKVISIARESVVLEKSGKPVTLYPRKESL